MSKTKIFYFQEDYSHFLEWLQLDIKSISWHYKNQDLFETFWNSFFIEGLSLKQVVERFEYLDDITETGPILSWFHWLKHHFFCFTFIKKQLSIKELAFEAQKPIGEIATIIRNYFIDEFPEHEGFFNSSFQISHISDKNGELNFLKITQQIRIPLEHSPNLEDEMMTRIELTLYDEWQKIIRKIKKDLLSPLLDIKDFRLKEGAKKHANIVRDLLILILLAVVGLFALKYFNKMYEKYLTDQIKIYKPSFIQKISPFLFDRKTNNNKTLYARNIKDFDSIKSNKTTSPKALEAEVFTTESDITLASWDQLPKNMNTSLQKKSIYEEDKKGGFRDLIYGTNRVYRILMRSVEPGKVTTEIAKYLTKYGIKQVDKVKPGTLVPGGHYYNIYVPISHLKEFISLVMKDKEALLFENKTWRGKTPRGMSKVLIWIKSV